jgi:acetyltransferase-like isoleucine patch superfamily enzyme
MRITQVFKKYRLFGDLLVLIIDIIIIGISTIPSVLILSTSFPLKNPSFFSFLKLSLLIAASYLVFGTFLILITCSIKTLFRLHSKTGTIPIISKQMILFSVYHNLIHLCDVFILKIFRSTSFINLYFKMMGANIGSGTIINTTRISDCDLISIGKDCIIGGDVVINGHSAENGFLLRERVIIGNNVTIGQYATILPGVIIGDNVTVGANTVVPKGKVLENNCIYIGNKISKIEKKVKAEEKPENKNFSILFKEIDNAELLSKAYILRHSEILSIERFISRVTISTLGLIMSLIMYSILNDQPKLIALLPTLIGFSYAIIINLSFGMLKLGAYMYRIELLFKKLNMRDFDWEIKEGILGIARIFDLDNIFINVIYFGLFIGGFYLIYSDKLFDENALFLNFSLKNVLLVLNLFIVFWILFISSYYFFKRNKYLKELKEYEYNLEKNPSKI